MVDMVVGKVGRWEGSGKVGTEALQQLFYRFSKGIFIPIIL